MDKKMFIEKLIKLASKGKKISIYLCDEDDSTFKIQDEVIAFYDSKYNSKDREDEYYRSRINTSIKDLIHRELDTKSFSVTVKENEVEIAVIF